MKRYFKIFFIFLYFFGFTNTSFASESSNFLSDYNTTYNILETGVTEVTFDVSLTNQTSQYYASSYAINVGFKNIENIVAKDSSGIIPVKVTKNNDGNNINLAFAKKTVGIRNKLNFSVTLNTSDIAQKSGHIWDINIPGLAHQNEFNSFNVSVSVPETLGTPSYIKPDSGTLSGNNLYFTKEQLGESGISISFGKEEIYKFGLSYHLENSNLFPIKTEIALPPTTNYQDVLIEKIYPKPLNVLQDQDGNWLAQYIIFPSKKLDVKVTGKARNYLHPKKQKESKEKLSLYLKEQPFWETSNSNIIELAKTLKTPHEIYNYVVKTLKYDFSRVSGNLPRLGAGTVLRNPNSAVCLEFTDLFIALSRAAGIPAREINGFAYTQNSKERPLSLVRDVLHSWPEYYDYDLETWVMVDPTWGNTTGGIDYFTTLDFDHLAFAIKGASSSYPIPAGGYKTSGKTKDVNVQFADNFNNSKEALSVIDKFNPDYSSLWNVTGDIQVRNIGNLASSPQTILVRSSLLTPSEKKISFGTIPPFGQLTIPVSFNKSSFLTNTTDTITIQLGENSIEKNIKISPLTINKWSIIGGISIVLAIIIFTIIINKTRHLSFSRKKK
ncbi:transglutaminase family protein [Candidatus Roizmanbacteria bacterium]|nr:transglutaminase family protein [Candidatus Roizmanbacteria bacterium]